MSSDLDLLARWRNVGARHSDEVVEIAPRVLKAGRLGEQGVSGNTLVSELGSSIRMGSKRAAGSGSAGYGADQTRHGLSSFNDREAELRVSNSWYCWRRGFRNLLVWL